MRPGDSVVGPESPVRVRRRHLRLTQAEPADQVGVSRRTVIAIEQGGHASSVYLARRRSRALGGTVEDLFTEESGVAG